MTLSSFVQGVSAALLLAACSGSGSAGRAANADSGLDASEADGVGAGTQCAASTEAVKAYDAAMATFAAHSTCAIDADCQPVDPTIHCAKGTQVDVCAFALDAADMRSFHEKSMSLGDAFCALDCTLTISATCRTQPENSRCVEGICRTQGDDG